MDIYTKTVEQAQKALGERLRAARLAANLTQKALAESAGVSQKTVANAEDGQNISVETLLLLLRSLGRLSEIEQVLHDDGPSPIELARRQGHQRQRASGARGARDETDKDWRW
tara:strand:+ start:1018 stop:1356 length:339 start_codon:yes stop_codon:yes gene_type:complete